MGRGSVPCVLITHTISMDAAHSVYIYNINRVCLMPVELTGTVEVNHVTSLIEAESQLTIHEVTIPCGNTVALASSGPEVIVHGCPQGPSGPPGPIGTQGPIGPRGPQGYPGVGVLQLYAGPIQPNSSEQLDTIPITIGQAVRWALAIADGVAGLCRTTDISATLSSSGPKHTTYANLGDRILFSVTVTMLDNNLILTFNNLHANPVFVSTVRIFINNNTQDFVL